MENTTANELVDPEETKPEKGSILTNRLYDYLKFVAQILLPAAGTFYFALAGLWGFPEPEKVVATIVALDTFLGVVLSLSSLRYNNSNAKYDGVINITDTPSGGKQASLILKNYENPADVVQQKEVTFKVTEN